MTSFFILLNKPIVVLIYIWYNMYMLTKGENKMVIKRTAATFTIKTELLLELKQLSKDTKIPQSRLLDEAIQDLMVKYKKHDKAIKESKGGQVDNGISKRTDL